MQHALDLAERGAGVVSPNPMVGAVLLGPDGEVWGEGWHGCYGGEHAEAWAVKDAEERGFGDRLEEVTMIVTLEPCSHYGKTPPCVDLIIEKGIPRVFVAAEDPNPHVSGGGTHKLREAGVEVTVGVEHRAAERQQEAFRKHTTTGRPLVTLKQALTLDGRVATRTGDSRWVTGEAARRLVHTWRAEQDAVLVGFGTAAADDPSLTVRHVPLKEGQAQPLRVVLDRKGELPDDLSLFRNENARKTVAVVGESAGATYTDSLEGKGGRVWRIPEKAGHLDLNVLLDRLGNGEGLPGDAHPVQSLLVEAGPGLATALLAGRMADRVFAFVAPKILGEGISAIGDLEIENMADALAFAEGEWEVAGEDMLFRGYFHNVSD